MQPISENVELLFVVLGFLVAYVTGYILGLSSKDSILGRTL